MQQELSAIANATPAPPPRCFSAQALRIAEFAALAPDFAAAKPFPHMVLDNVINLPADMVCAEFPHPDWPHWRMFKDAYQRQKCTCDDIDLLPELFRRMVAELSSPAFLQYLEGLTGITGLLPDPYLAGGGLHASGPGGILAPHADFHHYGKLNLYRRINVLLYFNPAWQASDGGSLELFRKGETVPSASIVPEYGRMVIFLTDDQSIHGFTKPIAAGGNWRNSLALYYYTSEPAGRFAGDGVTYWQTHGEHRGLRLAQLLAYKALQRGAWTLSKYAHALNPNLRPDAAPLAQPRR